MSICSGIGNGIGGAIGKWGAGLGSALGLGAVVDVATRAYTGYGLLETLNVPYIECPDGSFVSAIEWYGSGLKCSKKPETVTPTTAGNKSSKSIGKDYDDMITALGGITFIYFGTHYKDYQPNEPIPNNHNPPLAAHYNPNLQSTDEYGNTIRKGAISDSIGDTNLAGRVVRGFDNGFINYGNGSFGGASTKEYFKYVKESGINDVGTLIGMKARIPNSPIAPPAAFIPPPPAFVPTPPPPKEDCEEVACPCLTPFDIQKAVKSALGLTPFAPEKLIRELGAKMFVAPGPSLVPIVPTTLVEAIAALVAANYMRAGYARYPVLMPQSLINDNSVTDAVPAQPLENYAEWFEWHIKQQDAIQGEWPLEIAIVDGAKRQPLKFENISEAFAELAGLTIQTATDADAAVAVATHGAVIAQKTHNATVIAQKNIECLIRFFGVRTGFKAVFIESAITPMDSDNPVFNLKKFLTPSTQSVAVLTDNDPFDFQAVMDRILRNSEIAKSAVAMDAKQGLVGDYTRNQRKYDAAETKKEAEKELNKLEASIRANNPDFKVRIKVDTAAPSGDLLGNNFVIKRPKVADE